MTLLDLVRLLRKNAVVLLIATLVGVVAAAAWTYTRPTVYQASSTGLVVVGTTDNVTNVTSGDLLAQQRAESYVTLINTRPVATRVYDTLGKKNLPVGGWWGNVVTGTAFIQVHASGTTPQSAQATADAALAGLVAEALRMETYGQVQSMKTPPPESQWRTLTSIHVLPYEPAALPGAPARANLVRNLLLGAVGGFLIGVALAVARRKLDVKVRSQSDVEAQTGHAVLGLVPDSKDVRRQRIKGVSGLSGLAGESLRKLRTNLRFVRVDDPVHSLVVTSANPGEGKSTVASNLARVMALSGQSVVLLDCDLRRPVQAKAFGIDSTVGLTQVLAGDIPLADAVVTTEVPGLSVLPAGRIPPNPSELVGSRKMSDLIAELSRDHLVIIDAPPMLAVTDASLLARASDGALLVACSGKTPKDQLGGCTQQLDLVGATLLGTVINRVPRRGFSEALYGYGGGGYISKQERYYTEAPLPGTIEVIPAAPMRLGRPEDATPMSVVPDPSPTLSDPSADMGPNGAHESSSHQSVADQPTGHVSTHRPRQAARARRGVVTDDTLHG